MTATQILRGVYGTGLWLVAVAVASCLVLGVLVWKAERNAAEVRLQTEVRQQESALLELVDSGTGIADLLMRQPDVRAAFADYETQSTAIEALNERLQPVLETWLLRAASLAGVVIRTADGRILGQAGISVATPGEPVAAPVPAPADSVQFHTPAYSGRVALTVPVHEVAPGNSGSITLLLSESAVSLAVWERNSHWQSAHYSLLTRTFDGRLHIVRPVIAGAVERDLPALDLHAPGLAYLDEVVIAWSGMGAHSAGVLGQVDAGEFSRAATDTALLVTSGAAIVFLLAGLLVMLRSLQLTRRLGRDLVQLRAELATQIREEQGLLATTAQMSTAARLAAIGHWVTQRTETGWVWTAATPEIARIYGVPRRRLIGGMEFSRLLVHPGDQARMHAIWDEVNRNPRRYEAEFRLVQPSGDVRHVVEVGEPVFDQSGVLTNFRGTMQDITEYRHSESVISEAEARLLQPPKSTTVCHWVSYENPDDVSDSRYTYSRSAMNLFGVPLGELPLRPGDMAGFIHPDDLDRVMEQYRQSGLSPTPYCICYRLLRPDGSVLWVEEISEPAFVAGGGITHTFGTMSEIPAPAAAQ